MRALKYVVPAMAVIAGLTLTSTASYGKAEYTKKEKKPCTFCHVDIKKPKELNDAGKYYGEKKTLEGFKK